MSTFRQPPLRGLHPPERLREILERERSRTDRNGDPFALLTLTPREPQSAAATLDHLAAFLKKRLRITDDVGWLEEGVIGVVLPGTPAHGAWKVADDVCRSFPSDGEPPLCKVYCYPSQHDGQRVSADRSRRRADRDRPVHALEVLFLQPLPAWKRCLDVMVSLTALVLLLPLLLIVAAAIKLTSPGPILFRQRRSGWGGKQFVMYKFRSMISDAEARKRHLLALNEQDGPTFKIRNDPRITPVGRLLRATSIDELPQLLNVLRGDMSLVGPRPLPCEETASCRGWERRRMDVMPGLTCVWQVAGRSRVSFAAWVRMDLQYIRSRCLLYDLKLLVQTIPAVILRKGAM